MSPRLLLCIATVGALVLTGCDDGAATGAGQAEAVAGAVLEETGSARLEGEDIVVELSSGPVRLAAADDTTFFVCDGDDCDVVDEPTFRASVTEGDSIRVLGPNAELLAPDAERLPEQVWVVLDQG